MQIINHISLNGYPARFLHISNPNKPSLVFLPGSLQDMSSLKQFSSRLSQDFNYFLLELPGTGNMLPLQTDKSVGFLGDCIESFVSKYINQPFYMVACSYGTGPALAFASKHSGLLKRLVLAGSMRHIPESDWPRMLNLAMLGLTNDDDTFAEQYLQLVSSDKCCSRRQQIIRKAVIRNMRQMDVEKKRCFTNNTLRLLTACPPDVEQIHCPTLCFTGEYDPYTTPELCQELAEAIPLGEFATIADTDHLFHIDKPQASMDLIMQFLTADRVLPIEQAA